MLHWNIWCENNFWTLLHSNRLMTIIHHCNKQPKHAFFFSLLNLLVDYIIAMIQGVRSVIVFKGDNKERHWYKMNILQGNRSVQQLCLNPSTDGATLHKTRRLHNIRSMKMFYSWSASILFLSCKFHLTRHDFWTMVRKRYLKQWV